MPSLPRLKVVSRHRNRPPLSKPSSVVSDSSFFSRLAEAKTYKRFAAFWRSSPPLARKFYKIRAFRLNSAIARYLFFRRERIRDYFFPLAKSKSQLEQNPQPPSEKQANLDFSTAFEPSYTPNFQDQVSASSSMSESESGSKFQSADDYSKVTVAQAAKAKLFLKPISFDRFDYLSSAFVAVLCRRGLKLKAERLLEDTLAYLKASLMERFRKLQYASTPVLFAAVRLFFLNALENVKPLLSLKKQVVAGVIRSSPIATSEDKRLLVAIRWVVAAAKARSEIPFSKALCAEILDAFSSKGRAMAKRSELHSVVVSSRAFLRLKRRAAGVYAKETFTLRGARLGLRLLLRRLLKDRFRKHIARIRGSSRSKKSVFRRLKRFLRVFSLWSFFKKVKFLLGFDRFIYIYRSKNFKPDLYGFFEEYLVSFSPKVDSLRPSRPFPKVFPIAHRLPILFNLLTPPVTKGFRFPRPPMHIPYDSLVDRHWIRPGRVLVMYRRERDPRSGFFKGTRSRFGTARGKSPRSTYFSNAGSFRKNSYRNSPSRSFGSAKKNQRNLLIFAEIP